MLWWKKDSYFIRFSVVYFEVCETILNLVLGLRIRAIMIFLLLQPAHLGKWKKNCVAS